LIALRVNPFSFNHAQEPSSYHWAVEKIGYPTEYELLVGKNQYIENVTCPVCGAREATVRFTGKNLRCDALLKERLIAARYLHVRAGDPSL
jgi:hypothetical protein